ncbi:MAG: preprotein translocase subunit YajC [Proteobacteria bacterium]|nr:preprotein translocase subunit YajC [Pseudomonadota bacterium]
MNRLFFVVVLSCVSTLVYADPAAQAQGPSMISNIIMVAGFLLIFYFMLIRPQTKRAKEHRDLITKIAKDDEVITSGGILGKVLRVSEQFIVISIAEGIEVKVQKQAISSTVPKGTMKTI